MSTAPPNPAERPAPHPAEPASPASPATPASPPPPASPAARRERPSIPPSEERLVRVSKYLSRHLRHQPLRIGLVLDEAGWTDVPALLSAAAAHGFPLDRAELEAAVAGNDKQRFTLEGDRIRANQGHSVPVDLQLPTAEPPAVLHHSTTGSRLPAIRAEGLRPMTRHDVHLSADHATAVRVGARRGRPVVLIVDAARMHADGHDFRISANGVWLTAAVPPEYLRTPDTR